MKKASGDDMNNVINAAAALKKTSEDHAVRIHALELKRGRTGRRAKPNRRRPTPQRWLQAAAMPESPGPVGVSGGVGPAAGWQRRRWK